MASPRKQPASSLGVGITSLMLACQQELEADVHGLLERKKEVIAHKDRSGKTALHYCAENTRTTCAEQIISARPEILNAQDDEGYSALHLAVISGNTTMVQFLVDQKADTDCEDNEKHTCVHWATVCGELECLDIVTRAGANPSTPDIHGAYPIHYAAQMCGPNSEMGNNVRRGLQVLHKLISKGVDVNCRDQDGRSPLLWAASSGSSDAIVSLVKAGGDVHSRDKDGLTALHCAASRGHLDCLETLITLCGAEVDAEDSNGCSALFYAVTLGHADCTNLLLGFGANSNLQDSKGRTAAHCGASKGQLETLRILGQHRTNLWIRNIRGDTPLHEAVLSGRKELVEWLLEQLEGSVNVTNVNGRTPLHIAAISNNVELCKVLMDHGAFVNPVMKNSKGRLLTPLDAALYRGYRGCAKYLQLHGALPSSKVVERKDVFRTEVMPEPPPSVPEKWQRVYRECAVQTDTVQKDVDVQVHLSQTERENSKDESAVSHYLAERRREGILKDPRKPIVAKVYLHTKRRERRPTRRVCDETRRKYDTPLPQEIRHKRTRIFHHTTTSTSSKSNVPSPQKRPVRTRQVSRTVSSHGEEAILEKVKTVTHTAAPFTDHRTGNERIHIDESPKVSNLCHCCPDPYQDVASLPTSCQCDCHTRIPPTPKPDTEQHHQEEFVVEMKDNMRSPSKQSNSEMDPDSQGAVEEGEVPAPESSKETERDSPEAIEVLPEKTGDIAQIASDSEGREAIEGGAQTTSQISEADEEQETKPKEEDAVDTEVEDIANPEEEENIAIPDEDAANLDEETAKSEEEVVANAEEEAANLGEEANLVETEEETVNLEEDEAVKSGEEQITEHKEEASETEAEKTEDEAGKSEEEASYWKKLRNFVLKASDGKSGDEEATALAEEVTNLNEVKDQNDDLAGEEAEKSEEEAATLKEDEITNLEESAVSPGAEEESAKGRWKRIVEEKVYCRKRYSDDEEALLVSAQSPGLDGPVDGEENSEGTRGKWKRIVEEKVYFRKRYSDDGEEDAEGLLEEPVSQEQNEESTARLDSEDENDFPIRTIYTRDSEEAENDERYFHVLPFPPTDSDEHSDGRRVVGFSDELLPSKKYLHLDQDEYSPLSSLRSIESNVKDSGYSDDVDREEASSENDDYGTSSSPKYMTKGKPFARFIVTSGAADTFPLEESEEIEEGRRFTPRSASMPTIELPTTRRESCCPRVLGRLMFNKDMQKTLRRYQLERRLFYELQELKRQQICGGIQEGEFETVKRMAERFKRHVFSAGMTDFRGPYTFMAFEKYLYEQLKNLALTYKTSTPKDCSHHNHSSRSYLSGSSDFSSKQGICVCQTHMCHHIRRPRESLYRSNDRDSVREVILPEISIRRRTTTFKMNPNRSSSWDRTDSNPTMRTDVAATQQHTPTRHTRLHEGSKSLPSLTVPLPKKIPTSLLSAICQRLGPDVHLDDTVVVELSSDEIKGKVRHSFTVREMREAVRQWEEATGRLLKPLHLERVLDPDQQGPVTFEIRHGHERNVFRLPTEKLNGDKKWQVIFTIGKNQRNVPLIAR